MLTAFHMFRDPATLNRVRCELQDGIPAGIPEAFSLENCTHQELAKMPMLSSIYAESLRLYVDALLTFSSPHSEVDLGRWRLPKGKTAVVSTSIAHRDETVWNTKDHLHPLDTFWAERFIVDPSDPLSGPVRPELRTRKAMATHGDNKPFFSSENLDGAWIPYGGNYSQLP